MKENNKVKAKIQEPMGTGYIFIRCWLYQRKKDSKDQIFCEYFDLEKYVIVLGIITQTQIVDFKIVKYSCCFVIMLYVPFCQK